jgi:maltose O-acetyltransferase
MIAAKKFIVNSVLSSRVVPTSARGRAFRLLGIENRARFSFGIFFGELNAQIGSATYINARCFFDGFAPIHIGNNCLVGMEVLFLTSHHTLEGVGSYGPPQGREIVIGDGCWIGARAMILPGVTICDGVVIGAGAVVTKSISRPGLYAGVPARLIREV